MRIYNTMFLNLVLVIQKLTSSWDSNFNCTKLSTNDECTEHRYIERYLVKFDLAVSDCSRILNLVGK